MKGQVERKSITDFSRGMNTLFAETSLADGESPYILNGELLETGAVKKRTGYEQLGTTQSDYATNGVINWGLFKSGTGTEILVNNGGTKVKYYTGSAWADLPSLPAIATADQRVGYQMYQNKLLMACQTHYLEWNGSGAVVDNSASLTTKGDLIMLDGELRRIYVSGDDDNPSTVYYTAVDSYTDFAGGGTIKVYENDGSRIMGMAMIFESRYVLKTNKIIRLDYDATGGAHTPIIVDAFYGAVGKEAWCIGENNVYFFTGTEVRAFGQFANYTTERSADISLRIKPTLLADIDPDYVSSTRLFFYDKKLILSYVSLSSATHKHDKQVILDFNVPPTNSSSIASGGYWDLPLKAGLTVGGDFYFGEPASGKIHVFNGEYNDNGAAIEFIYESKADNFGDSHLYKVIRFIDLEFDNVPGSLVFNIIGEDNSGGRGSETTFTVGTGSQVNITGWNVLPWGPSRWTFGISNGTIAEVGLLRKRKSVRVQGQNFKLQFTNDVLDESFTLYRIDFILTTKPTRRYSAAHVV